MQKLKCVLLIGAIAFVSAVGCGKSDGDGSQAVRLIEKHVAPFSDRIHKAVDANGKSHIVKLTLYNEHVPLLVPHLKSLPQLRELSIYTGELSSELLRQIAALDSVTELKILCNDNDLQHLQSMVQLHSLGLRDTSVTDDGLKHLAGMANLEQLDLFRTNVRGPGLVHLSGLTELKELNLSSTPIDDRALKLIAQQFKKLKRLTIVETAVTPDGLMQLVDLHWLSSIGLPDEIAGPLDRASREETRRRKVELLGSFVVAHQESKRRAREAGEDVPPDHVRPFGSSYQRYLARNSASPEMEDNLEAKQGVAPSHDEAKKNEIVPEPLKSIELLDAIFYPYDTTTLYSSPAYSGPLYTEGPVISIRKSEDGAEGEVVISCKTGKPEFKGAFFAIVQSYFQPFGNDVTKYSGMSSVSFYQFISPALDAETTDAKLIRLNVAMGRTQGESEVVPLKERKRIEHVRLRVPLSLLSEFSTSSWVRIFRPVELTDEEIQSFPEIAKLQINDERTALERTEDHLRRIGKAIHRYIALHRHLPPAVVDGPDGDPWHCWRVLILPFLGPDEKKVFDKYDLTQSFFSEKNQALRKEIPTVYRPASDPNLETTQFTTPLGERNAFSMGRFSLRNDEDVARFAAPPHFVRFPGSKPVMLSQIRDGMSKTILVCTMPKQFGFSWLSPMDIQFKQTDDEDDSVSLKFTPYESGGNRVGVCLFGDGRVDRVPPTLNVRTLVALCTIAGGEAIRPWHNDPEKSLPVYEGKPAEFARAVRFEERSGETAAVVYRIKE